MNLFMEKSQLVEIHFIFSTNWIRTQQKSFIRQINEQSRRSKMSDTSAWKELQRIGGRRVESNQEPTYECTTLTEHPNKSHLLWATEFTKSLIDYNTLSDLWMWRMKMRRSELTSKRLGWFRSDQLAFLESFQLSNNSYLVDRSRKGSYKNCLSVDICIQILIPMRKATSSMKYLRAQTHPVKLQRIRFQQSANMKEQENQSLQQQPRQTKMRMLNDWLTGFQSKNQSRPRLHRPNTIISTSLIMLINQNWTQSTNQS